VLGSDERIHGIAHPSTALHHRHRRTLHRLERSPPIRGEELGELRLLGAGLGKLLGRRLVLRIAGIPAQQQFHLVRHTVAIAVFARDEGEAGGEAGRLASSGELMVERVQALAEGVVWKFFERLGFLALAGQVAGYATVQVRAQKAVEMPFQGSAIGGCGGGNGRAEQQACQH